MPPDLKRAGDVAEAESPRCGSGFETVYNSMERARVSELKREIPNAGKVKDKTIELRGPGQECVTYVQGQTVLLNNLAVRASDGSLVWTAFNVHTNSNESIYRRDLSDQVLEALEQI